MCMPQNLSNSFVFFVQIAGKTIEESIEKEFSGEIQTALLTMGKN